MPHQDSGSECCVGHWDGSGNVLPQCIKCPECHQFIRPESMGTPCPGASGKCEVVNQMTKSAVRQNVSAIKPPAAGYFICTL